MTAVLLFAFTEPSAMIVALPASGLFAADLFASADAGFDSTGGTLVLVDAGFDSTGGTLVLVDAGFDSTGGTLVLTDAGPGSGGVSFVLAED